MFFNALNEHMREIFLQNIDKHDILAWIIYSTNYNPKGYNGLKLHQCYITNSTVAKDTKIDKSKVQRILKNLENTGYFKYFVKSEGGKKPSIIDVNFSTWSDAVVNVVNDTVSDTVSDAVKDIENTDIEGFNDIVNDAVVNVVNDTVSDISSKKESKKDIYSRVITRLNELTGKSFRPTTKKTIACIDARLNEKFTEEDFYKVIEIKTKEWLGTKMEIYLRPETLFGNKFEGYLNQQKAHDPVEGPKGKVLDFKIGGE